MRLGWNSMLLIVLMYDFMLGVTKGRKTLISEGKTLFGVEAFRGEYL